MTKHIFLTQIFYKFIRTCFIRITIFKIAQKLRISNSVYNSILSVAPLRLCLQFNTFCSTFAIPLVLYFFICNRLKRLLCFFNSKLSDILECYSTIKHLKTNEPSQNIGNFHRIPTHEYLCRISFSQTLP